LIAAKLLSPHWPAAVAAQIRAAPEFQRVSAYILGADADLDLDEIWEYIAADNIGAADYWIGKLFDAFEALGYTPRMGHKREDLTPTVSCSGRSVLISSPIAPTINPSRS
jgi:plasmid stabilization system protein ParE